jgi:hypothetical protein
MDTDLPQPELEHLSFWAAHRFLLLIVLTIAISCVLTAISMALYATSGAAQLDLSRPGYKKVTNQIVNSDSGFQNYSSTGPIDATSLNSFKDLYETQAINAKAVDAFGGDPINPDSLDIGVTAQQY